MLRFSINQVQSYAHSAGLYVAKWSHNGTAYRFRVFGEDKDYHTEDEDWLFETTSLAEVVAFVRGYRKALAKYLKEHEPVQTGNGKKEQAAQPKAKSRATKGRTAHH